MEGNWLTDNLIPLLISGTAIVVGSLVSLVWRQHSNRVDAIDGKVEENRKEAKEALEKHQERMERMDTKIFDKLDTLEAGMGVVAKSVSDLHATMATGYMSKQDCATMREKVS